MRATLYSALVRRYGLSGVAEWALGEHFERLGWGIGDLLAAPDEVLLQAKGFGPKALERWRRAVPQPVLRSSFNDPWREHAAMIALMGA